MDKLFHLNKKKRVYIHHHRQNHNESKSESLDLSTSYSLSDVPPTKGGANNKNGDDLQN